MSDVRIPGWVRKVKAGNLGAAGELVAATQASTFRFCLLLCGDRALAQDLAQDAYVRALDEIRKLKDPERFRPWLHRIARNLFLDHVKSPSSRVAEPSGEEEASGGDPALSLHLRQTLQQLPPEERLLLLLVDLEGYSYREAGEVLGISEGNVKFRLHEIRNKFILLYDK